MVTWWCEVFVGIPTSAFTSWNKTFFVLWSSRAPRAEVAHQGRWADCICAVCAPWLMFRQQNASVATYNHFIFGEVCSCRQRAGMRMGTFLSCHPVFQVYTLAHIPPTFLFLFFCLVCHTALSLLLQKQGSVALTWLGGNVERGLNKHNQLTAETVMIAMVWGLIVWDFYIVDSYYPVNVTPKFWHFELLTSLTKSQRGHSMNGNGHVVSLVVISPNIPSPGVLQVVWIQVDELDRPVR